MPVFCPQIVPNDIYKQKSESNLLIALTFLVPEIGFEPILLLNRGILRQLDKPKCAIYSYDCGIIILYIVYSIPNPH